MDFYLLLAHLNAIFPGISNKPQIFKAMNTAINFVLLLYRWVFIDLQYFSVLWFWPSAEFTSWAQTLRIFAVDKRKTQANCEFTRLSLRNFELGCCCCYWRQIEHVGAFPLNQTMPFLAESRWFFGLHFLQFNREKNECIKHKHRIKFLMKNSCAFKNDTTTPLCNSCPIPPFAISLESENQRNCYHQIILFFIARVRFFCHFAIRFHHFYFQHKVLNNTRKQKREWSAQTSCWNSKRNSLAYRVQQQEDGNNPRLAITRTGRSFIRHECA